MLKNAQNIFTKTGDPIFTKLGMKYLRLQPIVVSANDGRRLTLTNFMVMSVLET